MHLASGGKGLQDKYKMTDEISQLEKQHLGRERSNRNTGKDVVLSVEASSSYDYRNVSEPIQKSGPSIQNDARTIKLIMLPLEEAVSNPNHEASMKEALTILAGNLSLFTDGQTKQLLEFNFEFTIIPYSWRDCYQSRIICQNFLAEFEKTKSLLETSAKEEEDLEDRYTQLESKEKEMMAQLEAIQTGRNEIT
ncbi:hypothetical protein HAX54_043517 [Datura stramonium]|uniref:Uncharacterized protein n=1 Tax=Datura stramonium TaxID=4076 RepID=A0ABS8SN93_DATST|nr:hypothetical protein [Datura stramonium]